MSIDVAAKGEPTPAEIKRQFSDALKAINGLRAERDEALKVLRAVEWNPHLCPFCRGLRDYGHKADCQLAAVLGGSE